MLSVDIDGPRSEFLIAWGLKGKIPVLLNPDWMAAMVMDFFHASQNTNQKSCFGILQPTNVNR